MSAPKVRAHHEELQKISSTFGSQSSAIAGINGKINSAFQTLHGGHWIGKGATAFFREMESEVMPSMKRLEKALADAARVTNQISQIMKQAEDEASGFLKL